VNIIEFCPQWIYPMMIGKFPRLVDDGEVVLDWKIFDTTDVVFDWTFGRHVVSYNEVVLDWRIFDTTDVVFDWTFGRHVVSYNEVVLDWKIFDTTEWCGGADGMASIAFLKIMMSYSIGHSVDTLYHTMKSFSIGGYSIRRGGADGMASIAFLKIMMSYSIGRRHVVSYNEVVLDWRIFDTAHYCFSYFAI
jgi:hypothetical protein